MREATGKGEEAIVAFFEVEEEVELAMVVQQEQEGRMLSIRQGLKNNLETFLGMTWRAR